MKKIHILVLTGIFAVLLLGIFLKSTRTRPELAQELYSPLEINLDKEAAVKIEAGKEGKPSVTLSRKDDVWQIEELWNVRADREKISRLLETLNGLAGEMRSDSEELIPDYGLEDSKALFVRVYGKEGKEADLLIGAASGGFGENFVRAAGSPAVYLANKSLAGVMGVYQAEGASPDPQYWADLDYFRPALADVRSFEIVRYAEDGKAKAVKFSADERAAPSGAEKPEEKKAGAAAAETLWKLEGARTPFEPDQNEIGRFIGMLADGRAMKAADPVQDYGFGKKGIQITAHFEEEGKKSSVQLVSRAEEGGTKYYLKASPENTVYEISEYTYNQLDKGLGNFLKDNPFNIVPERVQAISLKMGDKELFIDRTEDRKAKFDMMTRTLSDIEAEMTLWDGTLPEGSPELPYRLEIKSAGDQARVYHLGETDKEGGKAFLLKPEGKDELYSLQEPAFRALAAIE